MIRRARKRSARTDQGFSLLEVLVAMLIIGLLVGVLTNGMLTTMRVSSEANSLARANVLLTSFEETLHQLEYRKCTEGDLKAIYQQAFDVYEAGVPADRQVTKDAVAEVVSVDPNGGCTGGEADLGHQSIQVQLTYQGVTRSGTLVKRSDEPADGPIAHIDFELLGAGQPVVVVQLDGSRSTPLPELIEFRWDCDDGNPVLVTDPTVDTTALCSYNVTGPMTKYITLTVTDINGVSNSDTQEVVIPGASSPLADPVAKIDARCAPNPAVQCTGGDADLLVNFDAALSGSVDEPIERWLWSFGDPLSGTDSSTLEQASHTYQGGGTFWVSLTVWTPSNRHHTTSIPLTVVGPEYRPIPDFSIDPGPTVFVRQLMRFDGSASTATGGKTLIEYEWNFGDGHTELRTTDELIQHDYAAAGTYPVSLTVTDSEFLESTISKTVTVKALGPPSFFRLTDSEGELADAGRFYFAWTEPVSPSTSVNYQFRTQARPYDFLDPFTWICSAFGTKTTGAVPGVDIPNSTTRTYTSVHGWPFSYVCLWSSYRHQMRTILTTEDGSTLESPWTNWTPYIQITHT